ncbi:cation diffusion facilitator family transporter [Sporolactobacillus sp. Y61]|jgi:cation diffusion facilitator family transporter|uniref:Cation diffusion facilitator family transporter n=1 Tax=Sporolactobacillus sp. Y61 TaxID=3160863 RepID=A0AAU8IE44_9BACL|nr:cation diffusion facilitator family transporter [Sporolactobacillus sp. THM19-2]RYL94651.1 cation transporter [Sporolactobacillus sp. THM19-2]
MIQDKYMNLKRGERGAVISIMAYLVLSCLKLIIGFFMNSRALSADGLNNATDIAASLAVLIGLKMSRRPADSDHPYGHWRSETIASLVASFIMVAVGLNVLYDSIRSIFAGDQTIPDVTAAWTGIFCAVIMYLVYRYNKKLARKINSSSVMAAAKDNLSDAWVSIGTAVGVFGSQLHLPWLDTVAAILVGILICKTGWDIFRESSFNLSDGFDEKKINEYTETIRSISEVDDVRTIKARNYGNNTIVDVVILVNPESGLTHAHDISTEVEKVLEKKHGIFSATVHVEPNLPKSRPVQQ